MYWQSRHQQGHENRGWNLCCNAPLRSGIHLRSSLVVSSFARCASDQQGPYLVIIRPCTSEYLEGWVRLQQRLWPDETLNDHRSYARSLLKRPSACRLSGMRSRRNGRCLRRGDLRRDYVNGCKSSPVGFLEGLYVEPRYRKRGLARLLCEAVEDGAKGMGCSEFASDVLLQNETGQRVHEPLASTNPTECPFISSKYNCEAVVKRPSSRPGFAPDLACHSHEPRFNLELRTGLAVRRKTEAQQKRKQKSVRRRLCAERRNATGWEGPAP